MFSCVKYIMSGQYKFDAHDEKVDEVRLVTNEIFDELTNEDEKTVQHITGTSETSKLPVITIILQIVMLALLVV